MDKETFVALGNLMTEMVIRLDIKMGSDVYVDYGKVRDWMVEVEFDTLDEPVLSRLNYVKNYIMAEERKLTIEKEKR